MNMYFGKILRRQPDNANPTKYKTQTRKYKDGQKHGMKANKKLKKKNE